ncbi:hypothetical protein TNIN_80771 [Trichonephila inaurata madagascariensis]|uniref:Uncharacterized protein n=1 Tax=Trichonephila inaurata madagascariensis TaxID=2747483 RepID=A0A8X7CJQ4_9ARAC|nr:hypothetical protein TNIN_80771 [Trichonephila inaurata madagascariensis]
MGQRQPGSKYSCSVNANILGSSISATAPTQLNLCVGRPAIRYLIPGTRQEYYEECISELNACLVKSDKVGTPRSGICVKATKIWRMCCLEAGGL